MADGTSPRRASRAPTDAPPPWRERVAALRHVPAFLRLVWSAHRGYAVTVAALRILRSGVPVATLWVGKLIVDAVVAAAAAPAPAGRTGTADAVWRAVGIEVAIVLAGEVLARASSYVESALAELFTNRMSVRIMEHAATLDLAQFEDPTFYDRLERARGAASGGVGLFAQLLGIAQSVLALASLVAALAVFDVRLLVLLLLAIIPGFVAETRYAGRAYSLYVRRTPQRRQLDYLRYVAASERTAKEVQLFGLAPWLVDRFRTLATRVYRREPCVRGGGAPSSAGCSRRWAPPATTRRTCSSSRARSPARCRSARMTFLAGAFARARDLLQGLLASVNGIAEQALYLVDLFAFLETRPTLVAPTGAQTVPTPIRDGFVFEGVGFRYPGTDRWAVRHLDVALRPGERVALVGENGAGKTTITKLLARLYDPTEGRIVLDGRDLRDYDLASVRAAIGVIFQDFVRYDMRFDENIAVGEIGVLPRRHAERRTERGAGRGAGRSSRAHRRRGRPLARVVVAAAAAEWVGADAGPALRRWRRPLRGRVAEGRARPRLPPRRTGARARRADRGAGRAGGVRSVRAVRGADGRSDGAAHLAPLLDGADGRPDRRAPRRAGRGGGDARRVGGARRAVRGAVRDAGGGVSVANAEARGRRGQTPKAGARRERVIHVWNRPAALPVRPAMSSVDRPGFRSDLEGLRGIAILLVVLFHAGITAFAGGFVGVDVFFVLSGFFVTGLLAREATETGTVDVSAFYGRRALRLLPALLVVLATTLLVVWLFYAPIDRAPIGGDARWVALSASNVAFAGGSTDYFSSGENPLLHTWSLAVEEQLYLVWAPLLSFLTVVAESRRRHEDATERSLVGGLVVVAVLSFGASLWLTRTSPSWAFFGVATRLWEFALGGLVLLLIHRVPTRIGDGHGGTLLQAAGLAAIVAAVVSYDAVTPYPGYAALLPALGTVALIVGGRVSPDAAGSRVLGTEPLRALGRLSYAWYLWHWPLVGLGGVLVPTIGPVGKLLWSIAALGPAWLTYRLVEGPMRRGRWAEMSPHRLSLIALVASVGAALGSYGFMKAGEWAAARPEQRPFAAAREDRIAQACWSTTADGSNVANLATVGSRRGERAACVFGDPGSSTTVVLFGDSHAQHWLAAVDAVGKARGWRVIPLVMGGCPVARLPQPERSRRVQRDRLCAQYRDAMVDRIVAMRPALAILSSWDHYIPRDDTGQPWHVTPEVWRDGLRRTYARVTGAGIPTVAIRGTPRTPFDVPACLSRRAARLPFASDCTYDRAASLSATAYRAQSEAARGLPVRFVDMNDAICATARCSVVAANGVVKFTDDNHLTASFTRVLAPTLGARIDAASSRRTVE